MGEARGYFLSFEGGEGTGKSTQVERLHRRLGKSDIASRTTREPGGTKAGRQVREVLLHTNDESMRLSPMSEALLFGLDRLEHLEKVIRPALGEGRWVLCDRFADSTLAYQGYALGGDIKDIKALNALVVGKTQPDLTFVLDVAAEKSLERVRARDGELSYYDGKMIEFHEKIRAAFLAIAKDDPERCVVIDADAPEEKVAERIEAICQERLGVKFP
ncbi:MAG: dTMP kinase [Hyphomicrobiales bacterium]|nr:dTMP kinase [Hyphomicrobiales bacterium]